MLFSVYTNQRIKARQEILHKALPAMGNKACKDETADLKDSMEKEDGLTDIEDVLSEGEDVEESEEGPAPRWKAPWAWNSEDDLTDIEDVLSEGQEGRALGR